MAEIPNGTKFLGVGSSVPTPELSGTAINSKTQYYTIEDLQGLIRPYKVYSALLTQSGTDAPVATVLENTLGDIVWSRLAAGEYNATLNSTFVSDKTFVSVTSDSENTQSNTNYKLLSSDVVYFVSYDSFALSTSDELWNNTSIEIRVYN